MGTVWGTALVMIFCMEVLSRGIGATFTFVGENPLAFIMNVNRMVLITLPALFFEKTLFISLVIQLPWLVAAMANHLMMIMRGTPFIWADLQSAGEGVSLASQYLTGEMLIKILLLLIVGIALLIWSFRVHTGCDSMKFIEKCISIAVIGVLALSIQSICRSQEVMATEAIDTETLYQQKGFLYGFINDMLSDTEGNKVEEEFFLAQEVFATMEENNIQVSSSGGQEEVRQPNIIMVQMEALFDPYLLGKEYFSEDPIPNIRKYLDTGYSGEMGVHTFSGGTARTEFEVLAAMNMDFISGGIPYTDGTIKEQGVETIAHVLRGKGYRTTAIHNHFGNFFDRDKVYSNLGFDTFIPKESMYPVVYENDWAKDEVVMDYIKRVLKETEETDFIFGVTAGTHGPYPFEYEKLHYGIEILEMPNGKEKTQLEKYIDRIHHLDTLIGDLINFVETSGEDIILVLYSDHGPNLEVLKQWGPDMKFKTFYAIIDNQDKIPSVQNQYIDAYQLYPTLFQVLGIQEGSMNKVHQTYRYDPMYEKYFRAVQQSVLKGIPGIEPTNMEIGIDEILITELNDSQEGLEVIGEGFTSSSKVMLDDKMVKTTFVSPQKLIAPEQKKGSSTVVVGQVGMENKVLIQSEPYQMP